MIAVDLDEKRFDLAPKLGAESAFSAKQENLARHISELCGGDGADATLEVVGAGAPLHLAIRCVRKAGR